MDKKELNRILENHLHYLNQDVEDWVNCKANLRGANLSKADLTNAKLVYINLSHTDLTNANLTNAKLWNANLEGADLTNAELIGADLWNANLPDASLCKADLTYAKLWKANLRGAKIINADLEHALLANTDLTNAELIDVGLRCANLSCADLKGAKLNRIDLRNVKIDNAINVPYIPMACPESGSFIAYKYAGYKKGKIIKLEILEDSKRSSASCESNAICRCDKALILEIQNIDGSPTNLKQIPSFYDHNFIYEVGKVALVEDFDDNRWEECAPGIHFFMNRNDAVEYVANIPMLN